jgi:signal-transduction protein with cAMP-binding, CBS, and nucleotidyltransferase domain
MCREFVARGPGNVDRKLAETRSTCAVVARGSHPVRVIAIVYRDPLWSEFGADRDICMAAYTQGAPLRAIPVTTAMAKHVFSCTEHDEVEAVERVMREHQIRRMPVIDDQGHPVGIVSLNDIARAASAGRVSASDVASTMAAISAPRAVFASAA